jgi:hypothetical protein
MNDKTNNAVNRANLGPRNARKSKAPVPVKITPEEAAKIIAARQQAEKEANEEAERVRLYGYAVEKMSHRQLRAELTKTIKREHVGRPPEPIPGLTIAFASVLLTVLDNTKTNLVFDTDKNGKPTRVARLDQINQIGRLAPYPL